VQSSYNQLNIALGVHICILQVYNNNTASRALKTHQNKLWNWLIRISDVARPRPPIFSETRLLVLKTIKLLSSVMSYSNRMIDKLNIVRNIWNMFLITVKAVLFLTKIDKSAMFTVLNKRSLSEIIRPVMLVWPSHAETMPVTEKKNCLLPASNSKIRILRSEIWLCPKLGFKNLLGLKRS